MRRGYEYGRLLARRSPPVLLDVMEAEAEGDRAAPHAQHLLELGAPAAQRPRAQVLVGQAGRDDVGGEYGERHDDGDGHDAQGHEEHGVHGDHEPIGPAEARPVHERIAHDRLDQRALAQQALLA